MVMVLLLVAGGDQVRSAVPLAELRFDAWKLTGPVANVTVSGTVSVTAPA